MYNYVLVIAAIKEEFTINSWFFVLFFFIYSFLDLDVYVLYQCSFGIFYAIKVVSFYLYFMLDIKEFQVRVSFFHVYMVLPSILLGRVQTSKNSLPNISTPLYQS